MTDLANRSLAERFAPMGWLLSPEDLKFFSDRPRIAASFRRGRFKVFLAYWRELNGEIGAFQREGLQLISHGAWDLAPHFFRKRAVLLYHQARLFEAALIYRVRPLRSESDVLDKVRESLGVVLTQVSQPVSA
jgi:hypothetical protein